MKIYIKKGIMQKFALKKDLQENNEKKTFKV
jgi:hypothetical protein